MKIFTEKVDTTKELLMTITLVDLMELQKVNLSKFGSVEIILLVVPLKVLVHTTINLMDDKHGI